jgi:outer membrane cobalamin receptor
MTYRQLLLCTMAAVVAPITAQAQTAPAAPPAASETAAPEIIVTGTAGGRSAKRMDASFAITSVSAGDLGKVNSLNSAEVLTLVPGVWVESSGGVAGTNIMVRGLPSTGDAPFVSFQLMGNPIYGTASLSFMDNSSMFRDDLTIKSVEAVNGGTGAVYSIGEPGLTVNHTLVEGTDETRGEARLSMTNYGTKRVDGVLSGKLADDLNFMIGGYATSSHGLRSTQFDSEVGQQITASITKHFDGGKLTIYSRYTDDHGAWYLPFAYATPGINQGTYTQLGNYSRYANIQTGANTTQTFDLGQGRGWKGTIRLAW